MTVWVPFYIPLVPPTYEFDISLIEKGFAEGAKALILCNPSNPCGKVFRRDELEAIAAAKGIDLSKAAAASTHGSTVPPTARYSTLQDLDAGRHTEIDMFSGALMRMGRELGIPTPYNEYTYHMIKALEEKNDGLFNYTATDVVTCSR